MQQSASPSNIKPFEKEEGSYSDALDDAPRASLAITIGSDGQPNYLVDARTYVERLALAAATRAILTNLEKGLSRELERFEFVSSAA